MAPAMTLARMVEIFRASAEQRGIEKTETGAIIATGEGVSVYRILALRSGLKLEVKCPGLRVSRGPKCSTLVKREFGFKGNPSSLLAQLSSMIDAAKALASYPEVK